MIDDVIKVVAEFKDRSQFSFDKIKKIDKYLKGNGLVHDSTITLYNRSMDYKAYLSTNNNSSDNDTKHIVLGIRDFMISIEVDYSIKAFNSFTDLQNYEKAYPATFRIVGDHVCIKKIEEFIPDIKMKLSGIEEIVNIFDSINYLKAEVRGSTLTNFCLSFNIDHGTDDFRCEEIENEIWSIIKNYDLDFKLIIS